MKLRVHVPVPQELRSREDRLRSKVPVTGTLLDTIRNQTDRFKYGISDSQIDHYYRFSDLENTKVFFCERFKQFHDADVEIDEEAVTIDIERSVNSFDFKRNRKRPTQHFRELADKFCDELKTTRSVGAPYVAIFRGPTGSGKTAYSKCLFSAGIWRFWRRGIIPTRVEFSKFFKPGQQVKTKALLAAVHQCQIRDFLLYLFFSMEGPVNDDIIETIAPRSSSPRIRNELTIFNELTKERVVDGKSFTLSDAHALWKTHVKFFNSKTCARILQLLKNPKFDIQFLVSLDGFDALKTKDFLKSENYHGPISAVADLLGESLNQAARYGESASSHNTNLMVYMRETTYERIRLEIHMGTSGQRELPVRWVVPPSYKILVNTIAASIDRDVSDLATAAKVAPFTKNIRSSMVRVLKDPSIGLSVEQPLSSAFSWNARHMKRHIRRVCIWSLENYIYNNLAEVDRLQNAAGLSVSWLWDKATRNPSLRNIYDYSVLEAFFLDDTRCLQSKFRLTSLTVQNLLNRGSLEGALNHLRERPELDGLFDSILNYLSKGSEIEHGFCYPHTLVLVRILQLLSIKQGQTIEDLLDDVGPLYPSLTRDELQFYLICLCENEYLLFHGTENSSSIDQCEFFLSNFGNILLNKVFYSATYFSQSIMLAELARFGLGKELRKLDFRSSEHWLSHCIFNAIVGYNIVFEAEKVELARVEDNDFKESIRVSGQLRISLVNEISRVFSVRDRRPVINDFYKKLPVWLEATKRKFPDFDALEELWGN